MPKQSYCYHRSPTSSRIERHQRSLRTLSLCWEHSWKRWVGPSSVAPTAETFFCNPERIKYTVVGPAKVLPLCKNAEPKLRHRSNRRRRPRNLAQRPQRKENHHVMTGKNERDSGTKCDPGRFRTGSKIGSELGVKLDSVKDRNKFPGRSGLGDQIPVFIYLAQVESFQMKPQNQGKPT